LLSVVVLQLPIMMRALLFAAIFGVAFSRKLATVYLCGAGAAQNDAARQHLF
jgi:hypothetical protein